MEPLPVGVTLVRMFLDLRAARIRQSDELGDLVEGLADGVVARPVEHGDDAIAHVVDR